VLFLLALLTLPNVSSSTSQPIWFSIYRLSRCLRCSGNVIFVNGCARGRHEPCIAGGRQNGDPVVW